MYLVDLKRLKEVKLDVDKIITIIQNDKRLIGLDHGSDDEISFYTRTYTPIARCIFSCCLIQDKTYLTYDKKYFSEIDNKFYDIFKDLCLKREHQEVVDYELDMLFQNSKLN